MSSRRVSGPWPLEVEPCPSQHGGSDWTAPSWSLNHDWRHRSLLLDPVPGQCLILDSSTHRTSPVGTTHHGLTHADATPPRKSNPSALGPVLLVGNTDTAEPPSPDYCSLVTYTDPSWEQGSVSLSKSEPCELRTSQHKEGPKFTILNEQDPAKFLLCEQTIPRLTERALENNGNSISFLKITSVPFSLCLCDHMDCSARLPCPAPTPGV